MGQTGILHNLRVRAAQAIAPRVRNPQREIWPYGDGSYSGYRLALSRRLPELRTDPYGLALAAETSVWANACIRLCSSSVARMRFELTDSAGNVLENTAFHAMMRTARLDYQQNLFYLWVQSLCVHGETYMEKVIDSDIPGFSIPGGVRILNAIAIDPQIQNGAVQYYQYSASGGRYKLMPYELFIHRYTSLTDDFRATAPMANAMDAVGIKRSMQAFMRGYFNNDATPGGIVTPKVGVTANATWQNRIADLWSAATKGADNANSTIFIPELIDYEQFDRKMPEHQQELSDDQIQEICAAFRVPVDMVKPGGNKDPLGGGGKMDSSRQMFYEDFVEPTCEDMQTYINDVIIPWLMPNSGVTFAFDFDEIRSLINDTKERSDKVINEFNNGVITFNQMQIALDYEPIPGGDWYQFKPGVVVVQAAQMPTIATLIAPPPPPLPPPPPAPAQLPPPDLENKDVLQLSAPVPPTGKSAAVMLHMGNHPDLVGLQNKTRAYVGTTPVKWNDPTDFHVTLASMPIVDDEQIKALQEALEDIEVTDMPLKVGSLNTFDNLDSHAVHFRVRKSVDLIDLQETLHDLINGLGIPMSSFSAPEAYKPHITVGYADSKPPARTFDSHLTVKPTALHLGVGDEVVWNKPIGDVITPEPPPEDKKPVEDEPIPAKKSEDDFETVGTLKKVDGKWVKQDVVVSYAESALDELAQWERKVKNKGVKAAFVNYLVRDEIADSLRVALTVEDVDAKAVFNAARGQLSVKAIQATRLDFENDFDDLLAKALGDEANRRTWAASLRFLLNKYSKQAYADGLTDGGVDPDEMDDEDKDALAAHLADQSQYVTGLGDAIYKREEVDDKLAQQKAAMWFNKSVYPAYQKALESADRNGIYEWVYGDTEHCSDCLAMNGQRHRLRDYSRKEITPKADNLECKGFNCKCHLVKAAGKARGNWLGAAKSEDVHTHDSEPAESLV